MSCTSTRSVQSAPEVDVGEQVKQYDQLPQEELEKRSNEDVVSAAKLREVESQLTEQRNHHGHHSLSSSSSSNCRMCLDIKVRFISMNIIR